MKIHVAFALAVLISTACNSPQPSSVGNTTKFHLLSQRELRDGMQAMANQLGYIAITSLDGSLSIDEQQMRIVPRLERIGQIALDIDGNGAVTNYSVINRYMSSFLYDVSLAHDMATRQPANLLPAQRLIQKCQTCHQSM
jgi:hypothetical protein